MYLTVASVSRQTREGCPSARGHTDAHLAATPDNGAVCDLARVGSAQQGDL
jgi:hypothetical protein